MRLRDITGTIETGIAMTIAGGTATETTTVIGITIADENMATDFADSRCYASRRVEPMCRRSLGLRLPARDLYPVVNWPNVNFFRDCGFAGQRPKISQVYKRYAAFGSGGGSHERKR